MAETRFPFTPSDRAEGWKRIRVGVTGLVAIVMLIGLASAMLSRISREADSNGPPVAAADTTVPNEEPLSELGVAPSVPAELPAAGEPTPKP